MKFKQNIEGFVQAELKKSDICQYCLFSVN
jgi:hypothetical protein